MRLAGSASWASRVAAQSLRPLDRLNSSIAVDACLRDQAGNRSPMARDDDRLATFEHHPEVEVDGFASEVLNFTHESHLL